MANLTKDNFTISYEDNIKIIDPEEKENGKEKINQYSHCLSNVDLIIILNDKMLFIELKNFNNISQYDFREVLNGFKIDKPLNKESIIYELIQKGRGSFIKEYSSENINNKDIYYFIIFNFNFKIRDARFIKNINDALKNNLPLIKNNYIYKKPFIKSVAMITIDDWKERSKNIGADKINFSTI
ncbi:DNA-binding protein [Brachyspira pilosicoli]|uniref:DNA-binding protein n=1 Tax=Brachyspira pilosicoli TaxID=52584 RepID=UPI0012F4C932|nr:DNA-binding protein [Brachyspira pilosicoli]WIH83684.1 DNA-binding protein [Brachyspira pilosicoli]